MRFVFILVVVALTVPSALFAQTDQIGSGRAVSMGGIGNYIEVQGDYSSINLPFTVTAWIKVNENNNSNALIVYSSNDNNPLYHGFWFVVARGAIWCEFGDDQGGSNVAYRQGKRASVTDFYGKWTHVAAVMSNRTTFQLYINGVNVGGGFSGESSQAMQSPYPGDKGKIGYFLSNGVTYGFDGQMDEVTIWNRALAQDEIRSNMCRKLSGVETGLVSYWSFDEISGTSTYDKARKVNNGVFKGNVQRVFSGAPVGDVSTFAYETSWTNKAIELKDSSLPDKIRMSNIGNNIKGVHLYEVKSTPSRTIGLSSPTTPLYFGQFIVADNAFLPPEVSYIADNNFCSVYSRIDNSFAQWTEELNPVLKTDRQREFIRSSSFAQKFEVKLGPDRLICDATSHYIDSGVSGSGYSYLWSNGATSPGINVLASGTYWVAVQGACKIIERDTVKVELQTTPKAFSLGADVTSCEKPKGTLTPFSTFNGIDFLWQDGSRSPTLEITDYGKYWVTASNKCGMATDTVVFKKYVTAELTNVQNVITPNGDCCNEFFQLPLPDGASVSLLVLNRWGERVFFANNYKNNWNGGDLSVGTYFYVVEGECVRRTKGALSIIR